VEAVRRIELPVAALLQLAPASLILGLIKDGLRSFFRLIRARCCHGAGTWEALPATDADLAFVAIANWGPAEDWADWDDAER